MGQCQVRRETSTLELNVPMRDTVDDLVLDLLEWVRAFPRPYPEVIEAWRTSCPRLPVWEEATERGFIVRHHEPGVGAVVSVSTRGLEYLHQHRQPTS